MEHTTDTRNQPSNEASIKGGQNARPGNKTSNTMQNSGAARDRNKANQKTPAKGGAQS
jgi:hypothetical protein